MQSQMNGLTPSEVVKPEVLSPMAMSDGHRRNATFYASIIGKLPKNKTVREALTNEQVARMLVDANK